MGVRCVEYILGVVTISPQIYYKRQKYHVIAPEMSYVSNLLTNRITAVSMVTYSLKQGAEVK
jgi:hypothetical protein